MTDINQILTKIRERREQKNYTQEYMANMLEVSLKTYSSIENHGNDITLKKLYKISEVLETPLEHFFGSNTFQYEKCDNSGYLSNYTYNEKESFQAAKEAWKQQIVLLQEQLKFFQDQNLSLIKKMK